MLAQESHGQTVLLRLGDGSYYALDAVAARIWSLCDGERSLDELVAAVSAEFDGPADVILADALEFVNDLRDEGLIVESA